MNSKETRWERIKKAWNEPVTHKQTQFLFVYRTITTILFLVVAVSFIITWDHVREERYPNCVAFCQTLGKPLLGLRLDARQGLVMCKCDGDTVEFYSNNYSYIRELTVDEILKGGFTPQ